MGIIQNINKWIDNWAAKRKEKQAFMNHVNKETLPIRRKAYLEEKKRQAVEEGKRLAKQKKQQYTFNLDGIEKELEKLD